MPSPFPGMNPYFEHPFNWEDFHQSWIFCAREALDRQVGDKYYIKAPERLILHELSADETERQSFLEIHDRAGNRIVTVIELISPSNKRGPDRDDYLRKRNLVVGNSNTHWVEIDLGRGGNRPWPPMLPVCDYYALVARSEYLSGAPFWPIGLREPLPTIPVPVSAPDPDLALDLQSLLHQVYDRSGAAKSIYLTEPDPPLSPEDAAWAKQFLPPKST